MPHEISSNVVPATPRAQTTRAQIASTGLVLRVALSNLPFAIALTVGPALPTPLKPLLFGAVVLVAPGLAWSDRRAGDAAVVLCRALLYSFALSLAALLAAMLPEGPTPRIGFLLWLATFTNVGLWLGARRGWYAARPFATPLVRALSPLAALFYLQCYFGAAHFIPPLEDQDMELQGTAYGLINALTPTMTTNDASQYYFTHPLLLHVLIGEAALISGSLEQLRYYHDGALALGRPPNGAAFAAWEEASYKHWEGDLEHFMRDPQLATTRTPNMWLSALLLFPLGFIAYRITGSVAAAVLSAVLYMTLPEVYVRSAYGGYMAIANLHTIAGAYFYLCASGLLPERAYALPTRRTSRRSALATVFCGAWADQKNVILPMATLSHAALRLVLGAGLRDLRNQLRARPEVLTAALIGGVYVLGWASYAAYGFSVAPQEFFEHHLRLHVMDRLALTDLNLSELAKGEWVYPSIMAVWQQFAEHSGWLVIAIAVAALVRATLRVQAAEGVLTLWVVLAAIGFSLVDWRMTKHFAQFLPALAILIGVFWSAQNGVRKTALTALLSLAIGWNMWRIGLLVKDFEYLKPLPIW